MATKNTISSKIPRSVATKLTGRWIVKNMGTTPATISVNGAYVELAAGASASYDTAPISSSKFIRIVKEREFAVVTPEALSETVTLDAANEQISSLEDVVETGFDTVEASN